MGIVGKIAFGVVSIIIVLLLVLNYQSIFVFFYKTYNPEKIVITCERDYLCVGKIKEEKKEEVWLNVKGRFLEKRVDLVRTCEGREINLSVNIDGCSDAFFYDVRPIDCDYAIGFCEGFFGVGFGTEQEPRYLGIRCSNWPSYCSAISSRNNVDVVIDNLEETGVIVSNSSS